MLLKELKKERERELFWFAAMTSKLCARARGSVVGAGRGGKRGPWRVAAGASRSRGSENLGNDGLSAGQKTALGLLGTRGQADSLQLFDVEPEALSAKVHYAPDMPGKYLSLHSPSSSSPFFSLSFLLSLLRRVTKENNQNVFLFFFLTSSDGGQRLDEVLRWRSPRRCRRRLRRKRESTGLAFPLAERTHLLSWNAPSNSGRFFFLSSLASFLSGISHRFRS